MAVDGAQFIPLTPWDSGSLYDTGVPNYSSAAAPQQTWPVPGTDELLALTGSKSAPAFVKYDANGNDAGFSPSILGSVTDLEIQDDGGFLVWGTVASNQLGWFSGGYDMTYNGGATDGFVAKIRRNGTTEWGTLIGGEGVESINDAKIVTGRDGTKQLVIVGSTTSRGDITVGSFVSGGDTVFDAITSTPSSGTGGTGATSPTNGFVMVLGPKTTADNRFTQHIWSSYLTPQDPTTLAALSPVGRFAAASGDMLLVLRGANGQADKVTILCDAPKSATPTTGGATTPTSPSGMLVAMTENPASPGSFQFVAKKSSSLISLPSNAVRRGNGLYWLDGPMRDETDATREDARNNIEPQAGQSGTRTLASAMFASDSSDPRIVDLVDNWRLETTVSVRSMFVDPFLTGDAATDAKRDAIYLMGTAFDAKAMPFGKLFGNYQKGYGDPVIVEVGLNGAPKRYQYVSAKWDTTDPATAVAEKGMTIGVTGQSQTLLVFANKYDAPLKGGQISGLPIGSSLYRYDLSQTTSKIEVAAQMPSGAVAILDGSTSATVATGTDFGKVIIGAAGPRRTFTITNSGSRTLVLQTPSLPQGFRISGGDAFDPTNLSVPANGGTRTFEIQVDSSVTGTFVGDISFGTNDPSASPFNFALKASVITQPPSTFSVAAEASSVLEGNTGTATARFTVTLTPGNPLPTYPLTVRYAAQGVTATAGQDFVAIEQRTLTFNQGETTKTVTVTVNGDTSSEPDETFKLVLSAASQGVISSDAGEATVTITNDDAPPAPLAIGFVPATVRVTEGNSGTRMAELTVVLNRATTTDVSVQYATANLTATAGSDYAAASGMLVIPAGSTQGAIRIPIWGDTAPEADEVFTVALSAATAGVEINPALASVTIANDDGAIPLPAVRISNPSVIEGNGGSPKLSFVISLAKALRTATVLSVATVDGTAKAGKDYLAYSGTVTIPAGRLSATVTVNVIPNRTVDGNRTLSLRVLSGSAGVATGVGTIRDDDRPTVSRSRQASQFALATAFASYAAAPASTTKKK
jgi:hypothetical protein